MGTKLNVALLAGGRSGDREVSLAGAKGVEKALNPAKFNVKRYDPLTDLGKLESEKKSIDFAFILLHGLWGEDGTVQGFLDLLDIGGPMFLEDFPAGPHPPVHKHSP